jgi:hypothetical protein
MAAAYGYADDPAGSRLPDELAMLSSIDRFGVQAVYGRPLSFHELRMMRLSENIGNYYRERAKAENWAVWAESNPGKAEVLAMAGKLYAQLEDE